MAAPVFQYTDDEIPWFSSEIILEHISRVNQDLALRLEQEMIRDDLATPQALTERLWSYDRLMYQTLQEILETWQHAHHQATRTSQHLLRCYYHTEITRKRYATMMDAYEYSQEEDDELPEAELLKKKKKRSANKKRRQEKEQAFVEKEKPRELDVAKRVREPLDLGLTYDNPKAFYWKVDVWDSEINVKDYIHFVSKGKTRFSLGELMDFNIWKYVYHCNGPWDAERLTEILQEQNILAYAIKRKRGPADKEVLHYKVVATELAREP